MPQPVIPVVGEKMPDLTLVDAGAAHRRSPT
jgi:hypothetical protein